VRGAAAHPNNNVYRRKGLLRGGPDTRRFVDSVDINTSTPDAISAATTATAAGEKEEEERDRGTGRE
jgi:hypothetical protein